MQLLSMEIPYDSFDRICYTLSVLNGELSLVSYMSAYVILFLGMFI